MSEIVYQDEKKEFKKVFKIFLNTPSGLIEPKEDVNDYGNHYETCIFEEYDSEQEALNALFNNKEFNEFSMQEFTVLPVYRISPMY